MVFCAAAVPASWAHVRGLPAAEYARLFGNVMELPPADVDRLVAQHTEYLGLHMQNTKYMAAEVPFAAHSIRC